MTSVGVIVLILDLKIKQQIKKPSVVKYCSFYFHCQKYLVSLITSKKYYQISYNPLGNG